MSIAVFVLLTGIAIIILAVISPDGVKKVINRQARINDLEEKLSERNDTLKKLMASYDAINKEALEIKQKNVSLEKDLMSSRTETKALTEALKEIESQIKSAKAKHSIV